MYKQRRLKKIPDYSKIIKKTKNRKRKRRIYISSNALNELGFLAKNLERNEEKLDEADKSIIEMLEKLKTGEIIEDYKWGINSIDALEIYICPIMEGMKPLILYQYLQLIGGIKHVKKDFFRGDDTNAN